MSAIQFLSSGGMASIGGDLPESERSEINDVVKTFGEKIRKYAISLQVPASILAVQQSTQTLKRPTQAKLGYSLRPKSRRI